ncbi:hypothetical protein CCR94_02775 [Rhodoblastus sphagnicola]|uniref:BLUF domain-containing protein n=1 Tax=Rhodoblastus sphagnicola TaxID=333368 RepID=A0A2S6NEY6_9HYPH|nr:hypothetical protein CCR94_02775 [Rhodoblastus sphagnicola]
MTRALHRLIYFSRRCVAVSPGSNDALLDILAVSRRNNGRLGLTGALMFNSGCFIQII